MSNELQNDGVNMMMEQFINNLTSDAGMTEKLDEETLAGLKKDLKERLENRIKAVILSQIPENKLSEFEKVIDSGDESATQKFCNENIVDFPELLAAEFLNFRNRYIA